MMPVVSSAEMLTDVNGIVLHLKLLAISDQLLASVSFIVEKIVHLHATVRCLHAACFLLVYRTNSVFVQSDSSLHAGPIAF